MDAKSFTIVFIRGSPVVKGSSKSYAKKKERCKLIEIKEEFYVLIVAVGYPGSPKMSCYCKKFLKLGIREKKNKSLIGRRDGTLL